MSKHRSGKRDSSVVDEAHARSGISKKLIRAVIKQLGGMDDELKGTLSDVSNHGADGGFSGFIYYTETVKFYKANKKDILEHLKSQASDFGTGVIEMIKGFRCAKDVEASEDDIGEVLYGSGKGEVSDQIANCLAWYALEEVARAVTDE